MEIEETISKAQREEEKQEWVRTAFIAWQNWVNRPKVEKEKKRPNFGEYLKKFGIDRATDDVGPIDMDKAKAAAYANEERVRKAFRHGP